MVNKKYTNPFKTGKFENPGVTIETSSNRLSSKIKKLREINVTQLLIGKTYEYTSPNPFPLEHKGALITIKIFGDSNTSVGYDYVRTDGKTGKGSMTLEHAEKYLKSTKE